jgi:hypothetical protein
MSGMELLLGGLVVLLVALTLLLALRIRGRSAPELERGLRAELRAGRSSSPP